MNATVLVALPAAALVIWLLLRSPVAQRLVAAPSDDRWHEHATPTFGGVGIFLGFAAGIGAALAAGGVHASAELLGILGGCALLFAAGFVDDVYSLPPIVKVAAQGGAAAIVLACGLGVDLVGNDVIATAIAVLWLVGMTNAFNLLDNMDGLAATMAGIAAAFFAIDAVTVHPSRTVLVISLALLLACAGFLPFNLRAGRQAAVFMGDSGSQMLGFALAAMGLSSSYKVAGTTVATLILPILVLAVPILDTALVTVVRLLEGRPIYQGGRDHTSHRLVNRGLSEKRAVILLAAIAAGLGGTSLAYNVLDNGQITLVGMLITFALLVQFASFLGDVEASGGLRRQRFVVYWRRLAEMLVDFALITAAFGAAFVLVIGGGGTPYQRHLWVVSLPVILGARYLAFILFGLYRGVWRYAGARDAIGVVAAVCVSEFVAFGILEATQIMTSFDRSIFVVDALIACVLVGASRFGERAIFRVLAELKDRKERRRTLIVGAGRGGRSLLRELRETPGELVVGFVDDDRQLRGRTLQGVRVLGDLDELDAVLRRARPDAVYVTIPNAARDRLDAVVDSCVRADVPCRFVRRETELEPHMVLGAVGE